MDVVELSDSQYSALLRHMDHEFTKIKNKMDELDKYGKEILAELKALNGHK